MTRFEIYRDVAGYYRWRLKAANGEIVAISESYSTKQSARISAIKVEVWAKGASIVEI